MLVGSVLTLAVLWLVLRRGWRQLAVAAAYQEVARQVGLWADTRGISVQGHLGDRRIWVGEVLLRHGPARRTVTWGLVDFARPLGLGLLIRRRSRRWLGYSDAVMLADATVARKYRIGGDDPQAIAALLRPDVQAAFQRLAAEWPRILVTDEHVRVDLAEPEAATERLRALVDGLVELAARLEQSRADLPAPPGAREHLAAWQAAAPELGLEIDPRYPAFHGTYRGRRVLICPRRAPSGWSAELTLWFRPHEESGVRIAPQRAPDGYWNVGQDIQLGDPAFDRAFVVKAWDPLWVSEVFGPAMREILHALASAEGDVSLDDRVLVVRRLALEPHGYAERLELATRAADLLGW